MRKSPPSPPPSSLDSSVDSSPFPDSTSSSSSPQAAASIVRPSSTASSRSQRRLNMHPPRGGRPVRPPAGAHRSEEHTSELQSLMRLSYAVFCLKKKTKRY